MFMDRIYNKEIMDDFSLNDGRIDKALEELHTINKFLGGNSVSKSGIKHFTNGRATNLKILDIGGGASDILYDLKDNKENISIYSLDMNKYSCHFQKKEKGNDKIICADAFSLPVREKSFDLVHVSLFLHHFNEDQIIELIKYFFAVSRKGIVINDLRRNILAYLGIRILTALFSKSELVMNDGPLSVKRAFNKKDLKNIMVRSGINNYIIKRKWAFRFMLIIPVLQNGQN